MKKRDFVTLIMSVAGGILFALGMCMVLLPEWESMTQGVVMGGVGLLVLLVMLLVRRKMDGKPVIVFNGRAIAATLFGVFSTAVFGVGMCMTMVWNMMVPGVAVGIAGIIMLLCLIPICKGLK